MLAAGFPAFFVFRFVCVLMFLCLLVDRFNFSTIQRMEKNFQDTEGDFFVTTWGLEWSTAVPKASRSIFELPPSTSTGGSPASAHASRTARSIIDSWRANFCP